jgi:hypothetical protein
MGMSPSTIILVALAVLCYSVSVLLRRNGESTGRERKLILAFLGIAVALAAAALVAQFAPGAG